jgi:pSer/pThr/pTyr-binding forkhead associated (FHA) protein
MTFESQALVKQVASILQAREQSDLDRRLGLYQVFLRLYEQHRNLLDEILELEDLPNSYSARIVPRYVLGAIEGDKPTVITNILIGATQVIHQPEGIWLVGRDREAAFSLRDRRLSRRHAAIHYVAGEGFYLVDFESTNGSYVNGDRLEHRHRLKEGDRVRMGGISFTFFEQSAVHTQVVSASQEVLDALRTRTLPTEVEVADVGTSIGLLRLPKHQILPSSSLAPDERSELLDRLRLLRAELTES